MSFRVDYLEGLDFSFDGPVRSETSGSVDSQELVHLLAVLGNIASTSMGNF